jgi:hypothetical protein
MSRTRFCSDEKLANLALKALYHERVKRKVRAVFDEDYGSFDVGLDSPFETASGTGSACPKIIHVAETFNDTTIAVDTNGRTKALRLQKR